MAAEVKGSEQHAKRSICKIDFPFKAGACRDKSSAILLGGHLRRRGVSRAALSLLLRRNDSLGKTRASECKPRLALADHPFVDQQFVTSEC
jgi:hypothetical protein